MHHRKFEAVYRNRVIHDYKVTRFHNDAILKLIDQHFCTSKWDNILQSIATTGITIVLQKYVETLVSFLVSTTFFSLLMKS